MPMRGTSEDSENTVLEEFERHGVPALIDLINTDPDEAKRWLDRNLRRMNTTAELLEGYDPPRAKTEADRRSASSEHAATPAPADEKPEVEGKFTKSSIINMTDFVILNYVSEELRAVSIDKTLKALVAAKLMTMGQKGALIARLHRMKDKMLLQWSKESRGQDICVTEKGRARAKELRDRVLHPGELEFLRVW
jgi:hypothetical protein